MDPYIYAAAFTLFVVECILYYAILKLYKKISELEYESPEGDINEISERLDRLNKRVMYLETTFETWRAYPYKSSNFPDRRSYEILRAEILNLIRKVQELEKKKKGKAHGRKH